MLLGINGRRLAPLESSSEEKEAEGEETVSLSAKDEDTEPTQADFQ